VTARLPLKYLRSSDADREESDKDELFQAKRILAGKSICIAGFEPEYCKDLDPKLMDGLLVLHSTVKKSLSELLGMHVVDKPFQEATQKDVDLAMILNGPGLEEHVRRLRIKQNIPLIGLCRNVSTEGIPPTKPLIENVYLDFLPEPHGPRKLARAILDVFKIVEEGEEKKEQIEATDKKLTNGEATTALDEEEIEKHKNLAVGTGRPGSPNEKPQLERKEDTSNLESVAPIQLFEVPEPVARTAVRPTVEIPKEALQKPFPESVPPTPVIQQERLLSLEPAPPAAPPPRSTPLSVLIVEDNHVNMMLLVTFAKKHGYEYERAINGLEALRAVENRAQGFNVILMGSYSVTIANLPKF
jgi:hypothetical protein